MDPPDPKKTRLPPAALLRRLPLVGGLLLLGILLAACQHTPDEDVWGDFLEADAGAVRGLTPEHERGHPTALWVDPENQEAYITMGGSIGRPSNQIAVVDLTTGRLTQTIQVGVRPLDLTPDPQEPRRLFVAHAYSPSISVIDTETKSVLQILQAPYYLERIAFTRDGSVLLATDRANDRLVSWDVQRETRGYLLDEREPIPTGPNPEELAVVQPPEDGAWDADRLVAVTDRHGGSITLADLETGNQRQIDVGGPPMALTARDGLLFVAGVGPGNGTREAISGTPETGTADLENSLLVLDLREGPPLVESDLAIPQVRFISDTAREDNAPAPQRILAGALPRALAWHEAILPPASLDSPPSGNATLWISYHSSDQVQALTYHPPAPEAPLESSVLTTRSGTSGERLSHLEPTAPLGPGNLTDTEHGVFETPPGPRSLTRLDDVLIVVAELPEQLQLVNLADCPGPSDPTAPCTTRRIDLVDDPVPYPSGDFERGERLFASAFPSADQDRSAIMCHPEGLSTGGTWALPHRDHQPVKIPRLDQVADNAPWLIDGSVQRPEDYLNATAGDLLKADPDDPNNLATQSQEADNETPGPVDGNQTSPPGNRTHERLYPGATKRLRQVDPDLEGPEEWMRLNFAYLLGERRVPPPPPFITTPEGRDMERGMQLFEDARVGCASCHIGGGTEVNLLDEEQSEEIPKPANTTRIKVPPMMSVWDRESSGLLWNDHAPGILPIILPDGHPCLATYGAGLERLWHGDATGRTCDSLEDLAAYVRALEAQR